MESAPKPLAQYVDKLHKRWADNRKHVELKWQKNLAAAESDPDAPHWKKSETDADWMSKSVMPFTRQKVTALHAVGTDVYLAGDKVPFMLEEDTDGPIERQNEDPEHARAVHDAIAEHEALLNRQLRACLAVEHLTDCWLSGAIYGDYWAKKYAGVMEDDRFEEVAPGVYQPVVRSRSAYAFKYLSVWAMFWDMEAVDDDGDGFIEQDWVSAYDLRALLASDDPFLLPDAIVKAIEEASGHATTANDTDGEQALPPRLRSISERSRNIRWREFWGRAPRKTVEDFSKAQTPLTPEADTQASTAPTDAADIRPEDRGDMVEVALVMAGTHVVRFALSDPTERPYVHGVMEKRLDASHGRSMPDNVENEQLTLNGLLRSIENSAKLASNTIFAVKQRLLNDPTQIKKLFPGMILDINEDCDDVRKAIQQVIVEFIGERMLPLVNLMLEFGDLSSNLPRAQQGMQAANPQTAYELQQRLERSGKYVGRVVKNFDVFVQRLIRDGYRSNMQDPDSGLPFVNARVVALGYAAFEQTVLRMQKLLQLLGLAMQSPDLAMLFKLRDLVQEVVRSMRIDPDTVLKSEEQWLADMQAQAESRERALQTALMEAQVMLEQANAQKSGAQAVQTTEKVRQDDERIEIERAKLVMEAERHVKEQEQPAQPAGGKGSSGGKMRKQNPNQGGTPQ